MKNFDQYMKEKSVFITDAIIKLIDLNKNNKSKLLNAIKYVVEVGGKRLRPIFVLETCKILKVPEPFALRVAISIELIHCYSLVHDDLPAMDNDEIRRGNPTCHIKFDEATAILVGDALQCLAFEILSAKETHPNPEVRCKLINELSKSSGLNGMVGGQMLDLEAEKKKLDLKDVEKLQRLKTGELFRFACVASSILSNEKKKYKILEKYALRLVLAFQIQDDILDVEGIEDKVGKKINKDLYLGKETFISILGINEAKKKAKILIDEALKLLEDLGDDSENLTEITKLIINRAY